MRIGIIGSGDVGKALAEGFAKIGEKVIIGSRSPGKLSDFKKKNIKPGNFEETAKEGEIIILAVKWDGVKNAIRLAGKKNFEGKIVVDVTNPIDFSKKTPLIESTPKKSGGLMVQKMLPKSKVVKAFNTVAAVRMTAPKMKGGDADLFLAGNYADAKKICQKIRVEKHT
jgi:predicted dinucleotide-binding enzyme